MTALESKALGIALEKLNLTEPSHERIAAWHRHIQRLNELIAELTADRDELRERLQNVESR